MKTLKVLGDRISVDLLLFRAFGPAGQELLEATLEANPGLADMGPVLPVGTEITVPDTAPPKRPSAPAVVDLFG